MSYKTHFVSTLFIVPFTMCFLCHGSLHCATQVVPAVSLFVSKKTLTWHHFVFERLRQRQKHDTLASPVSEEEDGTTEEKKEREEDKRETLCK